MDAVGQGKLKEQLAHGEDVAGDEGGRLMNERMAAADELAHGLDERIYWGSQNGS